ncbi:MAG: diaminopimelate epimerase [Lachnospiraceae bacterium]|nr:diaminopimelate epimerase [Lachnospiraceae bacterium]
MKFTKMHGCGNDYIYINGMEENVPRENRSSLARKLSDRHFGIGSDGLIFINDSEIADFEMEMYNADGSRAQMCGNGIRCVAKYVYDKGLTGKKDLTIESCGKIKEITVYCDQKNKVDHVRVNMGCPELRASEIPVISGKERVIDEPVKIGDTEYRITCVSMGNPHAVVFMNEIHSLDLAAIGPKFECDGIFPERVNTEFVRVADPGHLEMRVWERGSGETLACGTGCSASAVAAVLLGHTHHSVEIKTLGGSMQVEWAGTEDDPVYLTGSAVRVFEGEI